VIITTDASLVGPWVCARGGGNWFPGRGTAIGKLDKNANLIAGVLYEDWNGSNIVCHIAGEGNWATKEFLNVIFDYPFNQVGAKRITAPVAESSIESIKLVTRMGFKLECNLKQATPTGDLLLFVIFKDDCKYLKGKYCGKK